MVEFICVSVLGGWQSSIKDSNIVFGPVFNRVNDLWRWQRENLSKIQEFGFSFK